MSLEILQSALDRGFADLNRRLDEHREVNDTRHNENLSRFDAVEQDLQQLAKVSLTVATFRWLVVAFVGGACIIVGTLSALLAVLHALHLLPGQ